jgi:hypothetical protein
MDAQVPQVITPDPTQVVEFGTFRHPETVLKEAELVARTFAARANKLALYKQIGESKHLLIEGWQTLAAMYRVTAGIAEDQYITIGDAHGYEATAEAIYVPSGTRISAAKAMCLSDEERWGMRPQYQWKDGPNGRVREQVGSTPTPLQQLRSMAQTRACSKVLSNLLKWVARMGGFAGTPAEEMTGDEYERGNGRAAASSSEPQRRAPQNGSALVSEAQVKRLYALGHSAGKSRDEVGIVVAAYGFTDAAQITRDRYEAICSEVMKPKGAQ